MDRPRILIVDDDQSIRATVKALLEDQGYDVEEATTGKEAIRKTQEGTYNLALLDIRLPDMEGVELLKLMKGHIPKMRKIMVTGYPSIQNAAESLNKEADAYLIKPVDVDVLLETVRDQLRKQSDERAFTEMKVAEFIDSRAEEIQIDHI